mgnify:CR=1 FL=1
MADTPIISVIIPVYNSKYIDDCLQSCFNQTLGAGKLEIIVINDASTDDTAKTVTHMSKHYPIKLINLDKNVGPAAARNTGLETAKGAYISFLDSDDVMKPDKLAKQLEFCRHNPDVGAVISGIEEIDKDGRFIRELRRNFPLAPKAQVETIFLDNLHTITSTLFFKRSLLESTALMNPDLLNLEDMDFALKLLQNTKMFYYAESLTIRRVLSSGLSHSVSETIFLNSRRDFYSNAVRMFPYLTDLEHKYWSLNYARLGRILQRQSLGKRARIFYRKSMQYQFNTIAALGFGLSFSPSSIQKTIAGKNWRNS